MSWEAYTISKNEVLGYKGQRDADNLRDSNWKVSSALCYDKPFYYVYVYKCHLLWDALSHAFD